MKKREEKVLLDTVERLARTVAEMEEKVKVLPNATVLERQMNKIRQIATRAFKLAEANAKPNAKQAPPKAPAPTPPKPSSTCSPGTCVG